MAAAAAPSSQSDAPAAMDFSYDDETQPGESQFPTLTPLSHDLELLSPIHAPNFSVDDFLLSRTKASDLNFILSDLRSYNEKLKDELYSIINEDYKDFVSLGSSLKAEAHRIARLGFTAPARSDASADHVPPQGLMAPVRDTLLASRSMLKSVQDDIASCMKRKEEAASHKARLELMLQLQDSIVRLEELLLIQQPHPQRNRRKSSLSARRPSVISIASQPERRGSLASVAADSDDALSDYAMSSEYDEDSDSDDRTQLSDALSNRPRRKALRRSSVAKDVVHDEPTSPSATRIRSDTVNGGASSLLGLPQRIARTSAEYSRLRFLHRRIDEEGLSQFTDVLQDRIDHVCSVLRQDLRALLGVLLAPGSLLVHGQSSARTPGSPELRRSSRPSPGSARRASFLGTSTLGKPATIHEQGASELDSWSQVAEPTDESAGAESAYWQARLDEQRSWLEMALATLNTLTLVRAKDGQDGAGNVARRRNEAEEAVRDLFVSKWAARTIAENPSSNVETEETGGLPSTALAMFQEHSQRAQSALLPTIESDRLSTVYNAVLTFVGTTAWQVVDAAREVSLQSMHSTETPASAAREDAQCDVFVHVLWDEISARLLDDLGTVIFFVGQTDSFYAHYTVTRAFLDKLSALAPTETSRAALHAHPGWTAFRRRWQLPVYFQMRFREVVTQLEVGLADGRARVAEGEMMQATRATLDAVARVWSDGMHIHELSAREWRVTLQILSRYKTWVEEWSPVEAGISNRPLDALRAGAATGSADGSRSSMDRAGSVEISRSATPQPAPDVSTQQHEDEQLALGAALVGDCLLLRTRIHALLDETILARISSCIEADSDGLEELRSDLVKVLDRETFDFIAGLVSGVGRLAFGTISPRVAAPLRLLRSFSTPAYRANSSSANAGVEVVQQLFAPLEAFLKLEAVRAIPDDIKRDWTEPILTYAFRSYTTTVETITKNQQSLIRLKKSQAPSSGLLGMFRGSKAADDNNDDERAQANKSALSTFQAKLQGLDLALDSESFAPWTRLKTFLESDLDQS
ncbi:hypothetical protein PaG_01435 [Moesziomyces aphidis]|uniref:Conserved oligomeric Golgi complex subunit 2 n=1 Tax=Moesziomyces aphidis TaxID=84754 RepID=W3VTT5_MOEAP|nr:hypothetical protein PaG_01435 [Moesziomyces aphidis]